MARVAGRTAGWFADPAGRFRFRYWNGDQWTNQVLDAKSREESTDVLEPHLRSVEPRPVLPSLPEPGVGDRTLADAPPNVYAVATAVDVDDGATSRTWRIPRPSMMLVVLLIVAGLVAGGAIWVLGQADDAAKPNSAVNQFVDRGITGSPNSNPNTLAGGQFLFTGDRGVTFTADPAPAGYHRTDVEGLSIPLPEGWVAMSPTSEAFLSLAARTGVSTTSSDYRALRLFVVTPGEGTATIVTKAPLAPSDLGQKAALQTIVSAVPGVVPGSVKLTPVSVATHALRIDVETSGRNVDGSVTDSWMQGYLVPVGDEVVEIQFVTPTDRTADPTFATIIDHVKRSG